METIDPTKSTKALGLDADATTPAAEKVDIQAFKTALYAFYQALISQPEYTHVSIGKPGYARILIDQLQTGHTEAMDHFNALVAQCAELVKTYGFNEALLRQIDELVDQYVSSALRQRFKGEVTAKVNAHLDEVEATAKRLLAKLAELGIE